MSLEQDIDVLRECAGLCMCENVGPEDALNSVARVVTEIEQLRAELERQQKALDVWGVVHEHNVKLKSKIATANELLVRAYDGQSKRPREANSSQVQLDHDVGQHLHRCGYVWNAIDRKWVLLAV